MFVKLLSRMIKKLFSAPIRSLSLTFFVAFFFVCLVTTGKGFTDLSFALVTIASFLFGIFISFSITSNQEKLSRINELLRIDKANLLSMYKFSKRISPAVHEKTRELIDHHLIDQIDYKLVDLKYSADSFLRLYDYYLELNPTSKEGEKSRDRILDMLQSSFEHQKQLEPLVQQRISKYEWLSLLSLLGLLAYYLIDLRNNSILSALLSTVLATTAVVLTLVLRDLNNLKREEEILIWEPLHTLFLNLDLLPYYSEEVLKRNKSNLSRTGRMRIASYPDPYPGLNNKKVRIVE